MTRLLILLLASLSITSWAEQAYIIDQTQVGIHQENSVDSPILKLLNTGEKLEVLERSSNMTQVRTEDDVTGWLKNEYMSSNASSRDELEQLKRENQQLMSQLEASATETVTTAVNGNGEEAAALQEALKAEKIRVGQLEAELLELRQKTLNGDNSELYTHISQLEQENLQLKDDIEALRNPHADATMLDDVKRLYHRRDELKRYLIYGLIILIIGIIAGIAITDFIHRQRHGGFRI